MTQPQTQPRTYQPDLLPRAKLFGIILLALAIAAGLSVGAWGILRAEQSRIRPSGVFPERLLSSTKAVQHVHETMFDLESAGQSLQTKQRHTLERWRWADKQRKLVYLPIEEAMRTRAAQPQRSAP